MNRPHAQLPVLVNEEDSRPEADLSGVPVVVLELLEVADHVNLFVVEQGKAAEEVGRDLRFFVAGICVRLESRRLEVFETDEIRALDGEGADGVAVVVGEEEEVPV